MLVLDGKIASQSVKEHLAAATKKLLDQGLRAPHLAAVLIGSDGASETYVASKVKSCAEIGFSSTLIRYEADVTEETLLAKISELNADQMVDGILVQLPLPPHMNTANIINSISADKDVDGFHPESVGRLVQGLQTFIPATPYGIMLMLEHYNIPVKGKHAVVVGRSNIVGRPMSILLSSGRMFGDATVTLTHKYTENLKYYTEQADILVVAVGKPGLITADMVKEGVVVIDVGITRVEDPTAPRGYRIKGDVDYNAVAEKASAITPVPGGVGLMTIAGLMQNTLDAYTRKVFKPEETIEAE